MEYFIGPSLPHSAVSSLAHQLWGKDGLQEVLSYGKGFFLFKFNSEEGMSSVVELGPWLLAGRQLVLKKWTPGLKLFKDSFNRIPV